MSFPLSPPVWIASRSKVDTLAQTLSSHTSIAIDTESNSLYAYQERVCLIQVSVPDIDYLIDPLAVDDLTSLGEIFADPQIEKVFHAAEYDLICLKRDFSFSVANIFDTRWAVRVLGYAGDGLNRLLAEKFDIKVDKKYQKTDWGKRPLSEEQINYARLDTHYLLPLKDMLQAELEERDLLQLAREDFERACEVDIPAGKPALWERMGNRNTFTPRELTILKELDECREQIAEDLNRPPFKVIMDKVLFDIARLTPTHADELMGLGMSRKQVKRWGRKVLQAVVRGQQAPLARPQQAKRPDEAYLSRLDSLKSWRKREARAMKVESDVILPRQIMELIAEKAPKSDAELSDLLKRSPWRLARFGPQILETMKG